MQVRALARPFQFWKYDAEAIKGGLCLVERLTHECRFVTRDGNVRMKFNRGVRGVRGDDMVMSHVPDARTAQVIVVTAALAQR